MTDSEKNQLAKGIFLTTGIVLGVGLKPNDGAEGILFALLSAGLFYSAFFIANKSVRSKALAYLGAFVGWFLLYKLFKIM
ncbi:hypothetical protein GCM10027594_01090 [Hymenobacter agri]